MQSIKTSFGFETVFFGEGNLVIHTCKVRLKVQKVPKLPKNIRVTDKKNGLIELAFETTNYKLAQKLSQSIGKVLQQHAQLKLDKKYSWVCNK